MSQMPVNIQPAQPDPAKAGGKPVGIQSEGGGFDEALRSASANEGAGQRATQGQQVGKISSSASTETPPRAITENQTPAGAQGYLAGEAGSQGELLQNLDGGDQKALEARLFALIRQLLGAQAANGEGQAGLGMPREGEEGSAALSQAVQNARSQEQIARFAALMAGKDQGQPGRDQGEAARHLSSDALLARLSPALQLTQGSVSGGSGTQLGLRTSGVSGFDNLSGLLQGLTSGGGARGEAASSASGQSQEGVSREIVNRLAGSEPVGREAGARADGAGPTSQGPSRAPSAANGVRVVHGQQGVPQAMVQVAKEAADGQRDVRLQLNPPHLGQLRVELQMTDQRIQAVFHVDNRHAASLLDGQMNTLRNALQAQQLDLEDVQVQVAHQDDTDGREESGEGQNGGRSGQWAAWGGGDTGNGGEDGEGPVGPTIDGGLSLYA